MVLIRKMKVSDYASAYALWESVPGMNLASLDNSEQGIARWSTKIRISALWLLTVKRLLEQL